MGYHSPFGSALDVRSESASARPQRPLRDEEFVVVQSDVDARLVSIVIITWNRPRYVLDSLKHLQALHDSRWECWVIDASSDTETEDVCRGHEHVHHVRFPGGAGHMTASRNEALRHVKGQIIAFLDDDALVHPDWLAGLRQAYADPLTAAVAGRTCNGIPGEEDEGHDAIGKLLPDGRLTGNFAARIQDVIEIDHGIGANMSFRRDVLGILGGFNSDYPGTALREDTDMFLRIGRLGLKRVYSPHAVVRHVAAPHVKGKRFDRRYRFWAGHNHLLLLVRNFGWSHRMVRTWLLASTAEIGSVRQPWHRRAANLALFTSSIVLASLRLLLQRTFRPLGMARANAEGAAITAALSARE